MFRRRRQSAPVLIAAAPPELSDDALLAIIDGKLADLIGASGEWTLVRRESGDTDDIFHTMLSGQIAVELAQAVKAGRTALRNAPGTEPSALPWTPAPVAVWANPAHAAAPQGAPVQSVPAPVAAAAA
ncbi:hypothetical protein SAMN04489834_1482 [Microterricola viridarii]|uniref:Uncharacterized protein n=1 Tax=Microterricola viridarii TaxID=412690 RepID=A0A1H1S753_9MICO|nr:hypothetical protein SAMN04489834_1482 [Microterricola viridarii]